MGKIKKRKKTPITELNIFSEIFSTENEIIHKNCIIVEVNFNDILSFEKTRSENSPDNEQLTNITLET